MKRSRFLFAALLSLVSLLVLSSYYCSNPTAPEKKADVVMLEGPIFGDSYFMFIYYGWVQNKGDGTAKSIRVYIYVRDSSKKLLAQESGYISQLFPGAKYWWEAIFHDENHAIRDAMDKSQTTYEIKWE